MEPLGDITWDLVICGTGLQQSLLALSVLFGPTRSTFTSCQPKQDRKSFLTNPAALFRSLSRSDKKILHIDPHNYYGGPEAALSLQEIDAWASELASTASASLYSSAAITRPAEPIDSYAAALSISRAYALSLAPQLIHANSILLSQLVSSRAYRQLEFLAVGSFFNYNPQSSPSLTCIPFTREDVFSTTVLSARAKRQLIKFLKLVLSHKDEATQPHWQAHASKPLDTFLADEMRLDAQLRAYIMTLTLSLDGKITTEEGLATVHRHVTSVGKFGPGFAAVYPKWGGGSEIAQVSCRACAVGGGVYMLGTGIKEMRPLDAAGEDLIELDLTDGTSAKSKMLVLGAETVSEHHGCVVISKLVSIIDSPLPTLFETTMAGAPAPAVAVIALPPGSIEAGDGAKSQYPIYAIAHSSETGECPNGQSTTSLLSALAQAESPAPRSLYQLYYEQKAGSSSSTTTTTSAAAAAAAAAASSMSEQQNKKMAILTFPTPPVALAFDDARLNQVQQAWRKVMGQAADAVQYMVFADREGTDAEDEHDEL